MKKILITLVFATLTISAFADNDGIMNYQSVAMSDSTSETPAPSHWTIKNDLILTFEQTQISNWAAGGFSNLSFGGLFKGFYNYQNGKHKVDNTAEASYARTKQDQNGEGIWDSGNRWIKSEDKIELNSIYGYQAIGNWNYSALMNLKSQFDNGYDKDSNIISAGLSPAILTSSVGMEYKKTGFSALFSFLTGKTTYCLDEREKIRKSIFGTDDWDRTWKFSLGSFVKLFYQRDVWTNVNVLAKLDFFWDYSKPLLDTDINGEVFVSMKINKYLNAFVSIQAAIDKDFSTHIQYKERFGISIPINF
ncbi:MAG: DUF3078 domain-containing protein [Bacteroidales bacterium]|nr:DUF3078 domain-containing protein [Bacteroidales bacterium]